MRNQTIKKLIIILLLLVLVYVIYLISPFILKVVGFIFQILFPFLAAFTISFILQPIIVYLQKKVRKRSIAVLIVVCSFVLFVVMFLILTVPMLLEQINEFSKRLPDILLDLEQMLNNFSEKFKFLPDDYRPSFDNLNEMLQNYLNNLAIDKEKFLANVFRQVALVFLTLIITVYFLIDYEKIICKLRNFLIAKDKNKFKNYLGELNTTLSEYVRGTLFVIFILTTLTTISFLFLKIEFALLFGLIIGITDIIPYLGPYIGAIPPLLIALLDSPQKMLMVALMIFIIQNVESNFLTPYIQSKKVKLHPLIVILALSFFGTLFGVLGMLVAVPLATIIRITFKYYPLKLHKEPSPII